jgi:hypothetical protein
MRRERGVGREYELRWLGWFLASLTSYLRFWSGRQDSDLRPLGPQPSALPSCATSRTHILERDMRAKVYPAFAGKMSGSLTAAPLPVSCADAGYDSTRWGVRAV